MATIVRYAQLVALTGTWWAMDPLTRGATIFAFYLPSGAEHMISNVLFAHHVRPFAR